MSAPVVVVRPSVARPARSRRTPAIWVRRTALAVAAVAGATALFFRYLGQARTMPVSADGAANALQAWDLLHGNLLLSGWTVSDVPFYPDELLLFALVELVAGRHAEVPHLVAALTYLLLVLAVLALARGWATGLGRRVALDAPSRTCRSGRAGRGRVLTALAIVVVPAAGTGGSVLLGAPDHTGSTVPVLLAWLLLDRRWARWQPYAVAGMLAWGQVADPLVMYVGALPLVLVSGVRLVRDRAWRGRDATLLAAGVGSVVLAQAVLRLIRLAGGFAAYPPVARFSPPDQLPGHLWLAAQALAVDFGGYLPDRAGPAGVALGWLHLVGLAAALTATVVAALRMLRRRCGEPGDRVADLLAVGILVNLGAFVASTQAGDLGTARQIVAVLPFGAVLTARIWGTRLGERLATRLRLRMAAVALILALTAELVAHSVPPAVPAEARDAADWLDQHHLTHGIGSYWTSNNITLATGGRVVVAPVAGETRLRAYHWESRADWYDPVRRDARFLVLDRWHPEYGTVDAATVQFGQRTARYDFDRVTVLLYDHNLLLDLAA